VVKGRQCCKALPPYFLKGEGKMARVTVASQMCRPFMGTVTEVEIEASNVRALIRELDRRYPGLGNQVEESMAVAIDGVICQDTYLEPINPDSEVCLIPKIAGG
jgi:molybdopterin synthase sulfur carrier subunit